MDNVELHRNVLNVIKAMKSYCNNMLIKPSFNINNIIPYMEKYLKKMDIETL